MRRLAGRHGDGPCADAPAVRIASTNASARSDHEIPKHSRRLPHCWSRPRQARRSTTSIETERTNTHATGFAPIKSIVEDAFARGVARPMWLYWGVRKRSDLYAL